MKVFLEILKANLKVFFYYKWDFFISVLIDPIILILFVALLKTVYANNQTDLILGYTSTQMIWYFAANSFFYYFVWSYPDKSLSESIMNGDMTIQLIRPLSLLEWEFAKALALKACSLVFNLLPGFIVFTIIIFPDFLTFESFIKYFLLSVFSFILFYLISFFIGTAAFKLESSGAIHNIKALLVNFMAGAFIPLDFYPAVIQGILKILPFQLLYYVPVRFLLNMPETSGWNYFFSIIGLQCFWIFIFYIAARTSWSFMVRKFYSVGG